MLSTAILMKFKSPKKHTEAELGMRKAAGDGSKVPRYMKSQCRILVGTYYIEMSTFL